MGTKVRVKCFCVYIVVVFSLFSFFFAPSAAEAFVPGDTINHTYSHTYSGNPWGTYFAEVGSWLDGSGCSYVGGNVFGPSATPNTPSSVSATCSFTAGSVGTTHTLKNWLQISGGGWVDKGDTLYTISAPPVASADLSLAVPSSMPVPHNSSVSLGVSYQNASNCNLYKSGALHSGNVGVGNVGVGNLTTNTGFSLNCTANSNTTGTPSDSLTVTVAPAPKSNQTITFAQPASPATYNSTFLVAPTSSSGLTVSVAASGGCTISGSTVTMTSGTTACTLTASQAGNASYNAATDVVLTVNAEKASQTISFGTLGNKTMGDAAFSVSASASSGLGVSFGSQTTGVCTVSGSTVTINGVGTCTIRASQAGNTNYNAAASVDRSFTVSSAFNYSLSHSGSVSIAPGNTGTVTISKTLESGTAESVSLSASGLPAGATASFSNNPSQPASPASVSTLTIIVPASAAEGDYSATVSGSKLNKSTSFTLSVVLPRNTLGVQTTLDGAAFGGIAITQIAGEPSDMGGATSNSDPSYYSKQTPSAVDVTLRAPATSGGNTFYAWLNCDPLPETTGRDCRMQISGGGSQTATARYLSPAALPNLWVSVQFKGATKTQGGWLASGPGQGTSGYLIATVSNSGTTAPGPFPLKLTMKHLVDETVYGETKTIANISQRYKASIEHPLYPGRWNLEACVDGGQNAPGGGDVQESNENDNCASLNVTLGYETPPDPMPTCWAQFTNIISGAAQWEVNVSGRIEGCPSSRYRFLSVRGGADNDVPLTVTFSTVFDLVSGLYRNMTSTEVTRVCNLNNASVIAGNADSGCDGSELEFGPIGDGTTLNPYLESGSVFSKQYRNRTFNNEYLFKKDFLEWGNYPFDITNYFEGQYACTLGGVQKHYHAVCDPRNVDYAPEAFQDPAGVLEFCSHLPADYTSNRTISPDWRQFSIDPTMRVCAVEGDSGSENDYFDMGCVPANPASMTGQITCGSGGYPPTNPPYIAPQQAFTPPVTVPQQPVRPTFTHRLEVKSTKDNVSAPGVVITQYAVSPSGYTPTGGGPGSFTNFGGTTEYYRLADRNFKITLEAEPTHPSGGTFSSWKLARPGDRNGCDVIFNRQCEMQFSFGTAGGESRSITANYTGKLDAPVVLTSPASCDANGGKINVYLQSAVSGATGYHIYRSTSPFTAARKNWFNIAHAQTAVEIDSDKNPANGIQPFTTPPTQANPFVDDKGLIPNTTYYYRAVAFNSSVSSPASAQTSRTASLPCPDLVVESISIKKADGTTAPTPIISGTALRFSASIKNQGGTIPTSVSFRNQFVRDGNTAEAVEKSLSGLGQGLSATVETTALQGWVATEGVHSIEVCADRPPLPPSFGSVNESSDGVDRESNNCSTLNLSVFAPLKVNLECKKPDGVYDPNYCIVDYAQTSGLRWTIGGTPSSCKWVQSDASGDAAKQSYTVTGNPFSLNNLLNKLNFKYQLECVR